MREILFRGKRESDGKWIYGHLFCIGEEAYICCGTVNNVPDMKEVDPETVCQYTGLKDKNGRKIFEGDIVSVSLWNLSRDKIKHTGVVEYNASSFVVRRIKENDNRFLGSFKGNDPFGNPMSEIEVIGNIFDNPELLGGKTIVSTLL